MENIGRLLMIGGVILFLIGGLVLLAAKFGLPFGHLPGDIVFKRIDDDGVVFVELVGACGTCPVSTMTLKAGVERIIMDRVPGITAVEEAKISLIEIVPDGMGGFIQRPAALALRD